MKKLLLITVFLGFVYSVTAQNTKTVPEVDIYKALVNSKEIKLSEVISDIEYLELKTPDDLFDENFRVTENSLKISQNAIVLLVAKWERVYVFDRKGNYVHGFEIRTPGRSLFKMAASWDLSPDGRYLVFARSEDFIFSQERDSKIWLYDIQGNLKSSLTVPWRRIKPYFLDNDHIVSIQARGLMEKDGCLVKVLNKRLEVTDSLVMVKSPGLRPVPIGKPAILPEDHIFRSGDHLILELADNDTVFKLATDLKLMPCFTLDLKEFRAPYHWYTNLDDRNPYIQISSVNESDDYFIVGLMGPWNTELDDFLYRDLVFDKISGFSFIAPKATTYQMMVNFPDDMDGFGGTPVKSLMRSDIQKILSIDSLKAQSSVKAACLEELKQVASWAERNNPIIRIVHLSQPSLSSKKIKIKSVDPAKSKLTPVLNVHTNHDWQNAEILSDMAYDPSDDSFWLVKMKFGKADSIEHRSRSGEILPGSFTTRAETETEAITCSQLDNTLWLSDTKVPAILHYDKQGNDLGDGFKCPERAFGMAYDPSDNTLWLADDTYHLTHYTTSGKRLGEKIEMLPLGADEGRGLIYDPRDNTLWILNTNPNKIIHISKSGELLPGTFYYNAKTSLADGAALDYKNYEFWLGDWGRKY